MFDDFLATGTDWIAGMDFPFGQPRKLIDNLEWPSSWDGYVGIIDKMGKMKFEETIKEYRQQRPKGRSITS